MPEQVQGRCCSIDDVYDARAVAEDLGIPYYVVNHEERFERDVVRPFIDEYLSGLLEHLEIKGATAAAQTKPATLETGLEIRVPLFIKEGEKVKVSTETREFVARA